MQLEYKSFSAPNVQVPADEPGTISAIVAVFSNVDHGKDRIRPGFFQKSLERKLPRGVWGHDWMTPVAKTLEAKELHPGDPLLPAELAQLGGLYIKGQFNLDTQRGREAYSDIKFGIIDEFSIGYQTLKAETDKKTGIRDLIEGKAFEWSPVLIGMNDQTRLLSVKSRDGYAPVVVPANQRAAISGSKGFEGGLESRPAFAAHSRDVVSAIGEYVSRAENRRQARVKAGRELSSANWSEIDAVRNALASGVERLAAILERTRLDANSDASPPTKADDGTTVPSSALPAAEAKAARVDPATVEAEFARYLDAIATAPWAASLRG